MPFVPAPNIVELQFRMTFLGEQTMNRIHINALATPTFGIVGEIATEALDWWIGNVKALVPPELELREIYCKSIATQPGPEATVSAGLPSAGTLGQPPLPSNCSLAVSLRSGETGRSARGRWFWQGLTEQQVTGNQVLTGTVAAIDAALTNLKNVIDGLGYQWTIVSYRSNNAPRPGGPVYFPVNNILTVDSNVDSQRRRLAGRGR